MTAAPQFAPDIRPTNGPCFLEPEKHRIVHTGRQTKTRRKTTEEIKFETALIGLLEQFSDGRKCIQGDLTQFLYSTIKPWGSRQTGAELASQLFMGLDRNYTLFRNEVDFLNKNARAIEQYFLTHFTHNKPFAFVSIGCGPSTSVECKDLPLVRAVGASKYIAIDSTEEFARTASRVIRRREPGIETESMHIDFTQPFGLQTKTKGHMVVLSILGDTIGQYPIIEDNTSYNGVSLSHLLKNLGKAIGHDGVLLATLDTERDKTSVETKYSGAIMRRFMDTFWLTAKAVTGDERFNPAALYYRPRFNPSEDRLRFTHVIDEETSITIRRKQYILPEGGKIEIGSSQKKIPKEIIPICQEEGWNPTPKIEDLAFCNMTRLISLTGQNTKMLETAQP